MDKRIKGWTGRLFYAVIAVVMTFGLLLTPASAPPVSAAEVNAEWDKVDTPSMTDWKIAPGSDMYIPALGVTGQILYVIGTMWVDENADGWVNYTEETARLWKSVDGGATWDDITENVMKEIRDEVYGSDQSLSWPDMVAWFNFITANMYNEDFIVMGAYLGDGTGPATIDPINWTQVVLVSDDGGENFELLPYPIRDKSAGTNLTDLLNMNISPDPNIDGVLNIAICGYEDPNRNITATQEGMPTGDQEGRVYRYRTGGLIGGWEDACTGKPGWINCSAVSWAYFSGLFTDDSTILAVTHRNTMAGATDDASYLQTGTWSGDNVNWNEAASRGEAAFLSNDPTVWWITKASTSGVGLPLDYDGRDKNTRIAWIPLNTAVGEMGVDQHTVGTIYRVVNGHAEPLTQQVPGRPWLAMVFYLGMIGSGNAVAGLLGTGHIVNITENPLSGLRLRTG